MMRSSKKRNNVGKCASCKFIYLSLITLGIKFLPLFLGTKRDNLRFFLSWNKLKSSKKSSTNPTILLSPIHFLLFLTSINYSSVRNIGESRSKSIRNLSNPIEKLRVPNLDDSSSECNGDASRRPTSRSTFSTLPRRSVIVSAIRFVAGNVVRVVYGRLRILSRFFVRSKRHGFPRRNLSFRADGQFSEDRKCSFLPLQLFTMSHPIWPARIQPAMATRTTNIPNVRTSVYLRSTTNPTNPCYPIDSSWREARNSL